MLIFAGVNPAGARSKWTTWKKIIRQSDASLWTMQETKCSQANQLKMDDFIIYEKVRDTKEGIGVAIAAKKVLNPVLISEGEDDIETISIDIHPSKMVISCTSAYGPQQRDSLEKKSRFWEYLDKVTDVAWKEGKGFYLQGDLNAWLGSDIIPGDPNIQNENGKLFNGFLKRHPQLNVVISLPVCQGLITRKRDLMSGKSEKSVIDFVVVCSCVLPYVTEMIIDEANQFITTNYTQAKTTKVKAINSDHNTQFVKVNLKVVPCKEVNREIFNLKNLECQMSFKRSTDKTYDFSSCFKGNETLLVKCEKWKKSLDFHIKKSFRKIKVKKNKPNHSAADSLIDKRNTMTNSGNNNTFEIDALIAQTILKEEINKAQEFKKFCNLTGTICLQKMWKMKKKLWPKKKTSLPTAKRNHKGRLITSPKELMLTLHKEYQDRLRPRKIKQGLKEHMEHMEFMKQHS